MILRFLAALVLCSSFTTGIPGQDLISWNPGRLSWDDFKALPPPNAANAALTSSSISLDYSSGSRTFSYSIGCHFNKAQSWGRVKNDLILAHEQGHFDLSEIYARRLNKALMQYRYNPSTANKDVNAIYQAVMQDLQQRQADYDEQSDHSRNVPVQKQWLAVISNELAGLEKYADYK